MERDDTIEYSLYEHHGEEEGRKQRKKIWFVFWVLLIVTALEVGLGIVKEKDWVTIPWSFIKWTFIIMTLVKAGYIVMTFMHLGDEQKNLRNFILIPYALFIVYFVFIALKDSVYMKEILGLFFGG